MKERHEYALKLTNFDPSNSMPTVTGLELRRPLFTDTLTLAELMIEAYRGTIDYDDETLEDAQEEVLAYLAARRGGSPLLDVSRLAITGQKVVSACLVAEWDERQLPIIAYMMTHAGWKNRGLGREVLMAVLLALYNEGYQEVHAVITHGNIPSERLFGRMGFIKLGTR